MALLLQWRHMSVLMFPITSRSTVCSIASPANNKANLHTLSLEMLSFVIPKSRFVSLLLQWRNMAVMTFQITGSSTGSGNGLAPDKRQAITWTNETSTLSHCRRSHLLYRNGVVITMMPTERYDVFNHQSLVCSFNSMPWLIAEQASTLSHRKFNYL